LYRQFGSFDQSTVGSSFYFKALRPLWRLFPAPRLMQWRSLGFIRAADPQHAGVDGDYILWGDEAGLTVDALRKLKSND
jgi:hypothetical protein